MPRLGTSSGGRGLSKAVQGGAKQRHRASVRNPPAHHKDGLPIMASERFLIGQGEQEDGGATLLALQPPSSSTPHACSRRRRRQRARQCLPLLPGTLGHPQRHGGRPPLAAHPASLTTIHTNSNKRSSSSHNRASSVLHRQHRRNRLPRPPRPSQRWQLQGASARDCSEPAFHVTRPSGDAMEACHAPTVTFRE